MDIRGEGAIGSCAWTRALPEQTAGSIRVTDTALQVVRSKGNQNAWTRALPDPTPGSVTVTD
ncbi:hypothetical protein [Chitinophaga sp.]|uniref:hypothetical protein n=1 Tax=Chitinophaga sp. TaxID=1869181 RepID=UPI0031D7C0AE